MTTGAIEGIVQNPATNFGALPIHRLPRGWFLWGQSIMNVMDDAPNLLFDELDVSATELDDALARHIKSMKIR